MYLIGINCLTDILHLGTIEVVEYHGWPKKVEVRDEKQKLRIEHIGSTGALRGLQSPRIGQD
jgi:hypothetical protein